MLIFLFISLPCKCPTSVGLGAPFYAYHAPGALSAYLEADLGLSAVDIALLFTAYSLPNLVLVALGGSWIDRYGVVKCSVAFIAVSILGQVLFAAAIEMERWAAPKRMVLWGLLVGRFVLGLGGECSVAVQQTMVAKWFRGNALTLAKRVIGRWGRQIPTSGFSRSWKN